MSDSAERKLTAAEEIVRQLEVDDPMTDNVREYTTQWISAIIAASYERGKPRPASVSEPAAMPGLEQLVEAVQEFLKHDGGPGSEDYDAAKIYHARRSMQSSFGFRCPKCGETLPHLYDENCTDYRPASSVSPVGPEPKLKDQKCDHGMLPEWCDQCTVQQKYEWSKKVWAEVVKSSLFDFLKHQPLGRTIMRLFGQGQISLGKAAESIVEAHELGLSPKLPELKDDGEESIIPTAVGPEPAKKAGPEVGKQTKI